MPERALDQCFDRFITVSGIRSKRESRGHTGFPGNRSCRRDSPCVGRDERVATLHDVMDHYDGAFGLGLGEQEQGDVVEYLESL